MSVLNLQRHFLTEMGGGPPSWLVRHRDYCKQRRHLMMQRLIKEQICHVLEDAVEAGCDRKPMDWTRKEALRQEKKKLEEFCGSLEELEKDEALLKAREIAEDAAEVGKTDDRLNKLRAELEEKQNQLRRVEARVESSSKDACIVVIVQEIKDLELAMRDLLISKELSSIDWQRNQALRSNLVCIMCKKTVLLRRTSQKSKTSITRCHPPH